MGHAEIENKTPFAFASLYASDQDGRSLLVPLITATYRIETGINLRIAEKQKAVNLTGEFNGQAGNSSYRYEPEYAFTKPATDVVLIGSAYGQGATEVEVRLRVGRLAKSIRVIGDRHWVRSLGVISSTQPEPFESIPMVYERAFGGWDRSNPDPERHEFEPRNPVGTGFCSKNGNFKDPVRLPNLEDPKHRNSAHSDKPAPAGFGFTSPDWQPRAALAGTYDANWMKTRMPLLPIDFDCRFFNAASPGLIAPGYLKGNEPVIVENASESGRLRFDLPGVAPPACRVQLVGRSDEILHTQLDTVVIDTDEHLVLLTWRSSVALRNGPHDVIAIRIEVGGVNATEAA